jgi:hypothetical protein
LIEVRLANPPEEMFDAYTRRERSYYEEQSEKVVGILNHKITKSLVMEVIEAEGIRRRNIKDIRVMILPSMRDPEYGDHLYGLYDHDAKQISIYPGVKYRSSEFLKDPMVSFQFIRESIITLIHEVLHAKYSKETTVKKLTPKYLKRFYRMLRSYLE